MYIYIYIYTHIHTYIHTHTLYIYIYTYTYTYVYVCVCVRIFIYVYVYVYVHIYVYVSECEARVACAASGAVRTRRALLGWTSVLRIFDEHPGLVQHRRYPECSGAGAPPAVCRRGGATHMSSMLSKRLSGPEHVWSRALLVGVYITNTITSITVIYIITIIIITIVITTIIVVVRRPGPCAGARRQPFAEEWAQPMRPPVCGPRSERILSDPKSAKSMYDMKTAQNKQSKQ